MKPVDIKVNVTFTDGYAQRYTAACLRQLDLRSKKIELQTKAPVPVHGKLDKLRGTEEKDTA